MTDIKTEAFTITIEGYTTESPKLRFVSRDGRNILQYSEKRIYWDKVEWRWVDVPLIQDGLANQTVSE